MIANKITQLPQGMMQLLADAEKYTVQLIRTQQQLLDADVAKPRDMQRNLVMIITDSTQDRPNSKRKVNLGVDDN